MVDTAFNAPPAQDVPLSGLPGFINLYRRHIPLALGVAVVVFAVVCAFTFVQTPRYSSIATVLIAPKQNMIGPGAAPPPQAPNDPTSDSGVDTQIEAVKSRELAETVVKQLGLDKDPEFNKGLGHAAVVDAVANDLNARRVGQSFLLEIKFTSKNPVTAAKAANAFADNFVSGQLAQKAAQMSQLNTLMTSRLNDLRQQAEAADRAVEDYRAANGLLTSGGTPLAEDNIKTLSDELATARSQQAQDAARLGSAQEQVNSGNGEGLAAALGSTTITQLRAQKAEVSEKVADLAGRYGPKNPDLLSAQRQLRDIDGQIQGEVNRVVASLRDQSNISRGQADALGRSLEQAQRQLTAANQASVKMTELQTDAQSAETIYQAVLAQVKTTSAQRATAQADAQIATRAETPLKQSYPIVPLNLAIGAVLGLVAGAGAAVARQGFNTTLATLEDVEGRLRMPYLASMPTMASSVKNATTKDPIDAVLDHPLSAYTESFRTLTAAVAPPSLENPVRTVVVTSSLPNEGKSTVAICMARTSAMGGIKTLLVDCDLRRRAATDALKLKPTKGLLDVLRGTATIDEALLRDDSSGAYVLPLCTSNETVEGILGSDRFDRLLEMLKSRFELVIIDTAPVLPVVDTRIVAAKADAVVLLVRWRVTPLRVAQTAIHQLETVGGRVTGIALSRVDLKQQARSGYGDPAYYYKEYGGYYVD